ncbi:hypothetical protein Tco_0087771 [Tanacetum coccineum]
MPTKVELTLEQSQQGVSDDVLRPFRNATTSKIGESNTSVLVEPDAFEAGNPVKGFFESTVQGLDDGVCKPHSSEVQIHKPHAHFKLS